MTTSVFTQQAEDQAGAAGYKPIDLIDGERLVELLIEHHLGIKDVTIVDTLGVSMLGTTSELLLLATAELPRVGYHTVGRQLKDIQRQLAVGEEACVVASSASRVHRLLRRGGSRLKGEPKRTRARVRGRSGRGGRFSWMNLR